MKKISLGVLALAAFMTACDPAKDDYSDNAKTYTEQALSDSFSFTQADENGNAAADGNYFTFETNPATVVTVYNLDSEGNENVLSQGVACGTFKISPKRGSSSTQTFYVRTRNADGSYITADKTATVYVPSELTTEVRWLASDAYGKKIWKWDTDFRDGTVWGNMGNTPCPGAEFATGSGIWWGATPEELVDQLQHSDTGEATGEEDENAYMEFTEEGKIIVYDAKGNVIDGRGGKYSVDGYDGKYHASENGAVDEWTLGTLNTSEGAILFPFQINAGGYKPTSFDIIQLDANHLKLVYANPGCEAWGTGDDAKATWWAFKSVSDAEASLTNFETKAWTWDTEYNNGIVWGDMSYYQEDMNAFINNCSGIWWGATPEELAGQLQHSDTGEVTGEEDANAYMTFDWKTSTIKTYDGSGKLIRSGKFEITNWGLGNRTVPTVDSGNSSQGYAMGILHTDEGSILWPFQINARNLESHDGIVTPTDFEIIQLDEDHLKLIYEAPGFPSWNEATWWAFKAK